ncbi:hypothetical protein [Dietzia sp.]|uniref:hypothetical protein n=1 Tax=Dietzia sp. TaxID=1871616 RepID=UPI002FD943EF
MRRPIAVFSALGLVIAAAAIPPSAAGQENTTSTSSFATTCRINAPSVLGQGGPMDVTPDKNVSVHVTAPDQVTVGDRYDVTFQIDPISVSLDSLPSIASLQRASRLKLDLQRPSGAKLVSSKLSGGNLNVSQAQIITVDENGNANPNGNVLRLTDKGYNTIGNGGNASTSSHAGLGMDLANKKSVDLEFPTVTLTFEAERAGHADIGVRTEGAAASYGTNPASFLTLTASASAPIVGTIFAPTYCSPRASATAPISPQAASMKRTDIVGIDTTTRLDGPDAIYLRTPAEFVATVSPNVPGSVTFVSGNQRTTVPVDTETGQAKTTLIFNSQPSEPVRAQFTPTDPRHSTSEAQLDITVAALETPLTIDIPSTASSNTRVPVSATVPSDARGTVTFTGGGQSRTVEVRDGHAASSLTFTEPGEGTVTATYEPSATSAYGSAQTSATLTITRNAGTSLALEGLDQPAYVAEPATVSAVVSPAEGTAAPQGTVRFVAGDQEQTAEVVDGRAETQFTFGHEGDVEVTATYIPSGTEQTEATDSGTLSVLDTVATSSKLSGPEFVEPGETNEFAIAVEPAGASGTAAVSIDGHVVAMDVPITDGEGHVSLTFPAAAETGRQVTVQFTPTDARKFQPHTSIHTVRVGGDGGGTRALEMTVTGPVAPVHPGAPTPIQIAVHPQDAPDSTSAEGYLTVKNNGRPVTTADGDELRIQVVRGLAQANFTFTGATPPSKVLEFTFHGTSTTETISESITITVIGADPGDDVDVDPSTGSIGSLDLAGLFGDGNFSSLGSLTGSLSQTRN